MAIFWPTAGFKWGESFGVFVFSADGNLISVPVVPNYNDQAKEIL